MAVSSMETLSNFYFWTDCYSLYQLSLALTRIPASEVMSSRLRQETAEGREPCLRARPSSPRWPLTSTPLPPCAKLFSPLRRVSSNRA